MPGPGSLQSIEAAESFSSDVVGPVSPGVDHILPTAAAINRQPRMDAAMLAQASDAALDSTLAAARRAVADFYSSTTLIALAQAYEARGDRLDAIEAAGSVLDECGRVGGASSRQLLDPLAARLAFEILFRAGAIEDVLGRLRRLTPSPRLRAVLAALLGSAGHVEEGLELLDPLDLSADAVRGYLLVLKGDFLSAVPPLRHALRDAPNDAASALNLSIALRALGSTKGALKASLHATRAAPGRQDLSLHYLEMLLEGGMSGRFDAEVKYIEQRGTLPTARFLVIRARALLQRGQLDGGSALLENAIKLAQDAGEEQTWSEAASNLVRIRAQRGKISRAKAFGELERLCGRFPWSDVVVVNLAQVADRRQEADRISKYFESVSDASTPGRRAFVTFQVAYLGGDVDTAADAALSWLAEEPENTYAVAAVLVSVGIGLERWGEAAKVAVDARRLKLDDTAVNNAAYVLAMAGRPEDAIAMLNAIAHRSFVMTATLGLAYLAADEIATGMRLYRRAAEEAEKTSDDSRSLMTVFQALVVLQLGLQRNHSASELAAMALPSVDLPDDWEDRPQFLQLRAVCRRHGWTWPPRL